MIHPGEEGHQQEDSTIFLMKILFKFLICIYSNNSKVQSYRNKVLLNLLPCFFLNMFFTAYYNSIVFQS